MPARTLYDKLWDEHSVHTDADGTTLLYIDCQLVHEVTSPQAFEGLRLAGRRPWRADSIVAVADHNVPTEPGLAEIPDAVSRHQERPWTPTAPSTACWSSRWATRARASCT